MFEAETELAVEIAEEAGRIVAALFDSGLEVRRKAGGDPVTDADRKADAWIRRRLESAFPQDAIRSEETEDEAAARGSRRIWIVDPLDGTREFVRGNTEFAVHIGLSIEGRPVLGVVHRPIPGTTWKGVVGVGAARREEGRDWSAIAPAEDGERLRLAISRRPASGATRDLLRATPAHETIARGGSGLKAVMVASGECDAYVVASPHISEWDACAPDAIVQAARGVCTDILGRPLIYNRPRAELAAGLLVASAAWHARLVEGYSAPARRFGWIRPPSE